LIWNLALSIREGKGGGVGEFTVLLLFWIIEGLLRNRNWVEDLFKYRIKKDLGILKSEDNSELPFRGKM
jgi:hypothetical protein